MRNLMTALIVAVACSPAWALSDEQRSALSHIGQVSAGQKLCSKIEVKTSMVALLMSFYQISLQDPEMQEIAMSKAKETIAAWNGKDEALACAAVMMLYGPNGSNVPDLMRWR